MRVKPNAFSQDHSEQQRRNAGEALAPAGRLSRALCLRALARMHKKSDVGSSERSAV